MSTELAQYGKLLGEIKSRIQQAQIKAALSANAEMIQLYWDIGRMIDRRQQQEGWGAKVIPRLSRDIRNELPEIKGFSERNLKRMIAFFREYPWMEAIVLRPVAQFDSGNTTEKVPQAAAQFENTQNLLDIGETDYYIDLLFYHFKMRCFVVIELKSGIVYIRGQEMNFQTRKCEIHVELKDINAESVNLAAAIKKNFEELGV